MGDYGFVRLESVIQRFASGQEPAVSAEMPREVSGDIRCHEYYTERVEWPLRKSEQNYRDANDDGDSRENEGDRSRISDEQFGIHRQVDHELCKSEFRVKQVYRSYEVRHCRRCVP